MRASACQCSSVSSLRIISLVIDPTVGLHIPDITTRTESLGHTSGRTAPCHPTSGRSSTPLRTNFPPLLHHAFVPGGRGRLASGQAELLDAFLHVPGVWLPAGRHHQRTSTVLLDELSTLLATASSNYCQRCRAEVVFRGVVQ